MAKGKSAKERQFSEVDANGIGTTTSNLKMSETLTVPVKFRAPSTASAFKNLVARAEGTALETFYLATLRGLEASAKVKVRNENTTFVSVGGKRIDLLAIPAKVAVAAVNARLSSLALLSSDLSEAERTQMLKREKAWYNGADKLVASGKAQRDGDNLKLVA